MICLRNLHPFVPSSQQTAEDQSECLACSMALLQDYCQDEEGHIPCAGGLGGASTCSLVHRDREVSPGHQGYRQLAHVGRRSHQFDCGGLTFTASAVFHSKGSFTRFPIQPNWKSIEPV
ncbi:hypothetical protein EMCRGX_G028642 [Ephydatia muelleri]